MQNFSSFISYTGFLTPFKVKTWFFYSINARYYLWEENNNAKMSRSIKILDVPKTFQFSFFFTPVCVYFQKISMARNAIFFYSSAEFSNCVPYQINLAEKICSPLKAFLDVGFQPQRRDGVGQDYSQVGSGRRLRQSSGKVLSKLCAVVITKPHSVQGSDSHW